MDQKVERGGGEGCVCWGGGGMDGPEGKKWGKGGGGEEGDGGS